VTPLAGVVEVETNRPTRLSMTIDDGVNRVKLRFPGSRRNHVAPVLGLRPGRTYTVVVKLTGVPGVRMIAETPALPDDFPEVTLQTSDPARMEPGVTILDMFRRARGDSRPTYTMILDGLGEVVWYSTVGGTVSQQLPNGNLLFRSGGTAIEMDLLGNVHNTLEFDDPGVGLHHEMYRTELGTYLSLSRTTIEVEEYPTSETDPHAPTATAQVLDEPVVEFASDGSLLNEWPLGEILDTTRIGYGSTTPARPPTLGLDWAHANAATYDSRDDSIIASIRHQDAVIKFSRSTGDLAWILGNHDNWTPEFWPYLLDPVGAPFEWQYHQHAPYVTPHGTVLLFDNGNQKASPFDGRIPFENDENYSRAVEYAIDESNMEIRQVWEFGTNALPSLFAVAVGDVDWLPAKENVLVHFGTTIYTGGVASEDLGLGTNYARIIEVTHDTPAERVFDVMVSDPAGGILIYRSERIPGLYRPELKVRPKTSPAAGRTPRHMMLRAL
jgi:hypothetical protein